MSQRKRAVITGMGIMSPLGESVEEYWAGLVQGRSGIGPMTLCDPTGFPCRIAGEVRGFEPARYLEPKEARRMARFSQLAVAAALRAREDAHLDLSSAEAHRRGVILGNGIGGLPTTEEQCGVMAAKGGMRVSPYLVPMILPNMAAANISRLLGLKGYSSTVITACAAGTQAIGDAARVIRRGDADVVFTGGCEASITLIALAGFSVVKALTTRNGEPQKAF
jgi:3-oxoacyl-[acyl-carrier-protein] synthase II